jgi:hypothetical protein
MNSIIEQAIKDSLDGQKVFCKFLSANDTGETGGHQAGIYISKPAVPILFNRMFDRGQNHEKWVKIKWQDDYETDTRFIYYGQKTRNEYRITNFGHGFPFLHPEYTGSLFVLIEVAESDYKGYIFNTDEEINQYLDAFGLSPADTNNLIDTRIIIPEVQEKNEIEAFIKDHNADFPSTDEMSKKARMIEYLVNDDNRLIYSDPDSILVRWINMEYKLFREFEQAHYKNIINGRFSTVDEFINAANEALNRRKSRAGKSLEHHLSAIFDSNKLRYTSQAVTEGNKRPDFLFPSLECYHDMNFPVEKLSSLAAKTTCKDRWRQVLNEADRLRDRDKFLCTLQQGVSSSQMDEMTKERVILVVPKQYIQTYPEGHREQIWTLNKFIQYIRESEQ